MVNCGTVGDMGYTFNRNALNDQRKFLEMTVEEFALNLEVSPSTVKRLLWGKAKTISPEMLRRLSQLGISESDIEVSKKNPRNPGRPRKRPRCPECGR